MEAMGDMPSISTVQRLKCATLLQQVSDSSENSSSLSAFSLLPWLALIRIGSCICSFHRKIIAIATRNRSCHLNPFSSMELELSLLFLSLRVV
jgi:hypothetical protein